MHSKSSRTVYLVSMGLSLGVVLAVGGGCPASDPPAKDPYVLEPYYHEGDATAYGIPLSVSNTAQFIEYYNTHQLMAAQDAIKKDALTALRAPCCDDKTAYTCCCDCNLAKSLWGLSAHLIVDKNYDAAAVRAAALQWLQFTRPDYYRVVEMEQQGLDPVAEGLPRVNSCYEGLCEMPFSQRGCGGMTALKLE
jgi:hypothetical protein